MAMTQNNPLQITAHPRVGVGVLILDHHSRALLTLRKRPPEAGSWSIVGGKLEYLETLHDCAVREALEEVGVTVSIEALLCVTDHLLPQENQHWVSPAYFGRVTSGRAKNCEPTKTREVRWFPLDQLPPNLTMTARNAIAAYFRQFPQSLNRRAQSR
ncbi:MAG TPA: NUDIX domain-containing protein [Candidatus Acidoferrum sp.]|nr:NUDIX domain-containing protein [Candidatus Acidoferrum sp.]